MTHLDPDDPEVKVVDCNGTIYLAGWDSHGWFNIEHVRPTHRDDEYVGVGEYPVTSLTPDAAETVKELL